MHFPEIENVNFHQENSEIKKKVFLIVVVKW